jgi:zinc transporter ZupT
MWPSILLHGLPFEHGTATDANLVLFLLAVGTFAAALAGLFIGRRVAATPSWHGFGTAFSAGALLFLFYDLVKEAAGLGQGVVGRPTFSLGLLVAFSAGLLAVAWLGRGRGARLSPAWAWVLGLAAHGGGEGWIVGTEAAQGAALAPLGALSFLLHKGVEAFTLASLATTTIQAATKMAIALGLAVLAGAVGGLWLGAGYAPLVLFASGAGAMGYVVVRLGRSLRLDMREAVALLGGIVFVFAAGLLHEI